MDGVKILITAAASAAAHKLKSRLNGDNVILGDYADLPSFLLASKNMIPLPNPSSAAYAHEMLTLCLDKNIETVYLLRNSEQLLLLGTRQLFAEYGIRLVPDIMP